MEQLRKLRSHFKPSPHKLFKLVISSILKRRNTVTHCSINATSNLNSCRPRFLVPSPIMFPLNTVNCHLVPSPITFPLNTVNTESRGGKRACLILGKIYIVSRVPCFYIFQTVQFWLSAERSKVQNIIYSYLNTYIIILIRRVYMNLFVDDKKKL